jgi:hypothetical protein
MTFRKYGQHLDRISGIEHFPQGLHHSQTFGDIHRMAQRTGQECGGRSFLPPQSQSNDRAHAHLRQRMGQCMNQPSGIALVMLVGNT